MCANKTADVRLLVLRGLVVIGILWIVMMSTIVLRDRGRVGHVVVLYMRGREWILVRGMWIL